MTIIISNQQIKTNPIEKHKCSVSNNGCQDGFRVVYGTKIGENMMYKSYFHSDMDN